MEYFSIGSGSSGNCAFVGTDNTRVLLDAGISGKKTLEALTAKSISFEDIDGILITHEHRDHIGSLGVLLRRYNIPVFASYDTIDAIIHSNSIGEVDTSLFQGFNPGDSIKVKADSDLIIDTLPISHDAVSPVAYKFINDQDKLAIVTDLGEYDDILINCLKGLNAIVIESNHDISMLETGIYPYHLKRRIAGKLGHLSNEDCGKLLSEVLHEKLKWIVLAHLSHENNYDMLARETVNLEISLANNRFRPRDFDIRIAPRTEPSDILRI